MEGTQGVLPPWQLPIARCVPYVVPWQSPRFRFLHSIDKSFLHWVSEEHPRKMRSVPTEACH